MARVIAMPGSQAQAWPEPIDILARPTVTGLAAIDDTCMPTTLCNLALTEGERLGVDPVGIAAAAIGVCSGVLSDDWKVRLKYNDKGWRESPRLWICLLAESGSKKSEQIKVAMAPVYGIEARHRQDHMEQVRRWNEDHARWKEEGGKKSGEKEPKEPKPRRILCSDFTVEALSEILSGETKKLLVNVDELATFLGMFDRYAGGGKMNSSRGNMLSAYEGGQHVVDRIGRGSLHIDNWSISLVGGMQPDRMRGAVGELASDGLLQRMTMIRVPTLCAGSDDDDRARDIPTIEAYRALIDRLARLSPHTLPDGGHPDIRGHIDDREEIHRIRRAVFAVAERVEIDPTLPPGLRQAASKWRGTLARIAAVFHCVNVAEAEPYDRHRLMPETLAMAARFMIRVVIPSTVNFYLEGHDDAESPMSSARWVAEHILAHKLDHISRRDIGRASLGLRGKADRIDMCMDVLCDVGWCRPNAISPQPAWLVNPAVHARFTDLAAFHRARREEIREKIRRSVADVTSQQNQSLS